MTNVSDVVICEPIRTAIGRYGGVFRSVAATQLGVAALTGLLDRARLARDEVDDIVLGHCYPTGSASVLGRGP